MDRLILNLGAKILYVCEHIGKIGWIAFSLAALLLVGAVILIDSLTVYYLIPYHLIVSIALLLAIGLVASHVHYQLIVMIAHLLTEAQVVSSHIYYELIVMIVYLLTIGLVSSCAYYGYTQLLFIISSG